MAALACNLGIPPESTTSTVEPVPTLVDTAVPLTGASPSPRELTSIPVLPTASVAAESDFIVCSGLSDEFPSGTDPDDFTGPWSTRILTATSTDGLSWTRTNSVLVDQADAPSILHDSSDRIWVYYMSWCESVRNQLVVMFSDDLETWTYKRVHVDGMSSEWAGPADPSVVLLRDLRFRMYFTAQPPDDGPRRTFSAVSSDGLNFSLEPGARFEAERHPLAPNVFQAGDKWVYFAIDDGPPPSNYFAISTDGLNFQAQPNFMAEIMIMTHGVEVPGGYRHYAFGPDARDRAPVIKSFFSSDGLAWTIDDGIRLAPDPSNGLETNQIKEPGVTQLSDDSYLLIYVSGIP